MRVSRTIDADAERVWQLLIDTRTWPDWGPTVEEVAVDEPLLRADMTGSVRTALGVWVRFEITRFEPGRRWDWRVLGVPATGHEVEPLGPGRCRASITVPAVAAPYALVCRRALERIAELAEAPRERASAPEAAEEQ